MNKFNQFIFKFEERERENKTKENSTKKRNGINGKIKNDALYERAKIRNLYLENLNKQKKQQQIEQDLEECTFAPKINKKSTMLFTSSKLNNINDMYERNLLWKMQKNEKIQMDKIKKVKNQGEYSYRPNFTELNSESVFSTKNIVKKDLSTILFLERQEKARKMKYYSANKYTIQSKGKYRPISTESSHLSSRGLSNKVMAECKAALHNELFDKEDSFFEDE